MKEMLIMKEMSVVLTVKRRMNLMSVIVFVPCLLLVGGNAVFAEPYLQLDANPATYLSAPEESIFATEAEFTLYALVNSEASEYDPASTFYLSAALVPNPGEPPGPDLGSYDFDGSTFNVVGTMEYGTPPIEVYLETHDLPSHGIYETYYHEYSFTIPETSEAVLYDSQITQGGPTNLTPGPDDKIVLYKAFDVDVSGLASGYVMHFDLYTYGLNKQGILAIDNFAPFSHDLVTIPTPGAVVLGMLGLGVAGLKLRKFA